MILIRLFFKLIFVSVAAIAGNFVGYQVREQMLDKPSHDLRVYQKGEDGEITIALNPIMTNFLPAVLIGMLSRPGFIVAFIAGIAIGAVLGDDYEDQFFAMLGIE